MQAILRRKRSCARADELLAGSQHRKLEVEDERAGERLRPFFAAAGWVADRLAVMRREGRGRPHADVEEVTLAETRALRVEWYLSYDNEPATQDTIVSAEDRISVKRGMRAFVVRDADGTPIGFTLLAATAGEDATEIDQTLRHAGSPLGRDRRAARGGCAGRGRPRRGVGRRR